MKGCGSDLGGMGGAGGGWLAVRGSALANSRKNAC